MMLAKKMLVSGMLALTVVGSGFSTAVAAEAPAPDSVVTFATRDCTARNNLDEIAAKFISRCRKASIRREFPGTHLSRNLGEIQAGKSANDKKAWKLLNDKRFAK
ncbi:hypothetical protein ACIP5L_20520 [Streptomyces bacillaris]|uniref:hypothetical protein n=1 Tax=Streptomyces bacillaris TaxID=68179 RepID=UPI0037FA00D5